MTDINYTIKQYEKKLDRELIQPKKKKKIQKITIKKNRKNHVYPSFLIKNVIDQFEENF